MSPLLRLMLEQLAGLLLIVGAGSVGLSWAIARHVSAKTASKGLDTTEAERRGQERRDREAQEARARSGVLAITEEEIARAQAQARRSA